MARQVRSAVFAAAYVHYKGHAGSLLGASALFFSFCMLIVGFTFLTPLTMIVTIPFLFAPAYFCLQMFTMATISSSGRRIPLGAMLRRYFSPAYYRVYRPFVGLGKAIGFGAIAGALTSLIYGIVAYRANPEFAVMFDRLTSSYAALDIQTMYTILLEDPEFLRLALLATFAFIGVALIEVYLHFSRHALNVYARRVMLTPDVYALNELFLKSYRLHKKDDVWPYSILVDLLAGTLIVASFSVTGYLAFAYNVEEMFALPIALAASFLFLSFLLPFWFCLVQVLSRRCLNHMVMDSYFAMKFFSQNASGPEKEMAEKRMASFKQAVDPSDWDELIGEYENLE